MIIRHIARRVLKALKKRKNLNLMADIVANVSQKSCANDVFNDAHQKKAIEYLKSRGHSFNSPFETRQRKAFDCSGLKIAVCMSGYLRTYQKTAESFCKNVLEPLNADLFIYTPSKSGVSWEVVKDKFHQVVSNEDRKSDEVTFETLCKYYPQERIKKHKIWEYDESIFNEEWLKDKLTWDDRDPRRVASFYYHIEKCNELKKQYEEENGFKYDIVIRLRGDLAFIETFNLQGVVEDAQLSNTVYYNAFNHVSPSGRRYIDASFMVPFYNIEKGIHLPSGEHYFNDFITVGNSHNMDLACSVYSNMKKYIMEDKLGTNPEMLFLYHIMNQKIGATMENMTTAFLFREYCQTVLNEFSYGKKSQECLADRNYNYIQNDKIGL